MDNQIRPLRLFKKVNPRIYDLWMSDFVNENRSIKQKENTWYWLYCQSMFSEYLNMNAPDLFFWTSTYIRDAHRTNIGTVSELGRLLLTGWYYDYTEDLSEDIDFCEWWALEHVAKPVYNAYHKKLANGEAFSDLAFKNAVKHIRENFLYYLNHENALKLYILRSFFNEELQPLLPEKPKELKDIEEVASFLLDIKQRNEKKDKDFYYRQYHLTDDYNYYLIELLESNGIPYQSFDDFKQKNKDEQREFIERSHEASYKYEASILNNGEDILKQLPSDPSQSHPHTKV